MEPPAPLREEMNELLMRDLGWPGPAAPLPQRRRRPPPLQMSPWPPILFFPPAARARAEKNDAQDASRA
jgi:hypothetical protein